MTVLFSDINGFSDICDSSSAAEVMEMLNEYFHKMVDIVLNNRGTIKQFVGDEIMAMYGTPGSDPDQAFLAIKTAVEMIDTLQEMKRNQGSTHRGFYETKIGIHTGMMKVGFIGSQRRMEYAAVGRDVNLAARLEALNKNLDPGPLTEESVFDWEALMDRLHRRDTEGLKRVCEMLNGASRKLIDTRAPGKEPGEGEKKTLLEGLNELLSNPDFYDQKTFSTVEISQKGRYLLDRGMAQLSPQERMRLNRLLLEALCDNEIDPAGTSYILISDDTFERAKGALYLLDGVKHIRLASQKLKGFEEKKTVYKLWKKGWK